MVGTLSDLIFVYYVLTTCVARTQFTEEQAVKSPAFLLAVALLSIGEKSFRTTISGAQLIHG